VGKALRDANVRVEVLDASATVSKQVRDGELEKLPYLLVVGDEEEKKEAVRVRERGKGDTGLVSVSEFLRRITRETKARK
ncbi:threonine--tRNA ligase, partial [Candidatus Parcubacteria bacterium]|nr:threonine--tRNA ligase [Candidatus Parcubacteria bacterium]